MSRISRDDLFTAMVNEIAKRSTCNRRQVGALVVRDGRPIGMGYAGSPSGTVHCIDAGCILGPYGGCIRTQHAEANCVSWAAREGIALVGATMYCSLTPCPS